MRRLLRWVFPGLVVIAIAGTTIHAEETIVFFRHGEKPSAGLGQLTCQGLNRALALPDVLRMASLIPAQFLRLDHELGRIAPGYRADLVLLDDSLQVRETWIGGNSN